MDSSLAYENNALAYLRERDKSLVGYKIVQQWANSLPAAAEVIEIACGGGYPVSKQLVETGLRLWAIDSSATLITKFNERFPDVVIQCERFQDSHFFSRKFDAALAVGLIFLLPEPEQSLLINKVAAILKPKGRFLFTAPTQIGTWRDLNTGIECLSLGQQRYQTMLESSDLNIVASYEDAGKNHYYEAKKRT